MNTLNQPPLGCGSDEPDTGFENVSASIGQLMSLEEMKNKKKIKDVQLKTILT